MQQVELFPSGGSLRAATPTVLQEPYLCYAATLAVYVHEAGSPYHLRMILTGPQRPIISLTAIGACHICAVTELGHIYVWSILTGLVAQEIKPPSMSGSAYRPFSVKNVPLGGHAAEHLAVLMGSHSMKIHSWKPFSSTKRHEVHDLGGFFGSESVIFCLDYKQETGTLLCGTNQGKLVLWDLASNEGLSECSAFGEKVGVLEDDPKVRRVGFDPLGDQVFLALSQHGDLKLFEVPQEKSRKGSMTLKQEFAKPTTGVAQFAWAPSQPGNFFTVDTVTQNLRLWNVSSRTSIATYRPSEDSLHNVLPLPDNGGGACVCLMFEDSSVGIYALDQGKMVFRTRQGHAETVFDVKFSRHDPDVLGSASHDGTIRLWNTRQMRQEQRIYAGALTVYAIEWNLDGSAIFAATGSGEVCAYRLQTNDSLRTSSNKTKNSATYVPTLWKTAVHDDVCWNLALNCAQPKVLASAGKDSYVHLLSTSDGGKLRTYKHPSPVFGLSFNNEGAVLATGCHDGNIRLFDIASDQGKAQQTISVDSAGVHHVVWSPLCPLKLLTGTSGRLLKVWDFSYLDFESSKPPPSGSLSKSPKMTNLIGHEDRVRGLAWSPLHKDLCLSGSWDSTIRLWDVVRGACLAVVGHHVSDVYSLTFHPNRPLIFASGSRDTTIRLWYLSALGDVVMDAAMGRLAQRQDVIEKKLGGPVLEDVLLNEAKSDPLSKLKLLTNSFSLARGAADIYSCVHHFVEGTRSPDVTNVTVLPLEVLCEEAEETLSQMNQTLGKRVLAASGGSAKSAKLMEAAEGALRLGKVKEYCELLFAAGEIERAIAAAPAVSIPFWQSLLTKAGDEYSAKGLPKAVDSYILAGQAEKAAQFLADRGHFSEAMVVVQRCTLGSAKGDASSGVVDLGTGTEYASMAMSLLKEFAEAQGHEFLAQGNPQLAAAVCLSARVPDEAVKILANGNCFPQVFALLCQRVPFQAATIDIGFAGCYMHCAGLGHWYGAATCIVSLRTDRKLHAANLFAIATEASVASTVRQLVPVEHLEDAARNSTESSLIALSLDQEWDDLEVKIEKEMDLVLLGTSGGEGSNANETSGSARLLLVRSWTMLLPWGLCREGSPPVGSRIANKVYQLAARIRKATGSGIVITPAGVKNLNDSGVSVESGDHIVTSPLSQSNVGQGTYSSPLLGGGAASADFSSAYSCLGNCLPGRSPECSRLKSVLSGMEISGRYIMLEDGVSAISVEEGREWYDSCILSPLKSGLRFNPFV